MQRHAKKLQSKAKKNQVSPSTERGTFTVTSATSGKPYSVFAHPDNTFTCTCRWSKYHDTRKDPCSHILSVMDWLERSGARTFSFWATAEDAQRQHKPVEQVGRGIWATSRKVTV